MKCKIMKEEFKRFQWILMALLTIYLCSCKDDESPAMSYDLRKAVAVKSYTPTEGGTKTRIVVTGSNFGTVPKIIAVRINCINTFISLL